MYLGYFHSLVYTAKKFSEKKLLKISVLNFGTKKVPCKKNPVIKKSFEMKSYYFETLFYRTFFLVSVWFHTKSPIIAEYAWEQHAKRGAVDIEKRPWLYSKYRCIEKSLFYENVLDIFTRLRTFFLSFFSLKYFLQNYISCDLTLRLYISSPYSILGKSPRN